MEDGEIELHYFTTSLKLGVRERVKLVSRSPAKIWATARGDFVGVSVPCALPPPRGTIFPKMPLMHLVRSLSGLILMLPDATGREFLPLVLIPGKCEGDCIQRGKAQGTCPTEPFGIPVQVRLIYTVLRLMPCRLPTHPPPPIQPS